MSEAAIIREESKNDNIIVIWNIFCLCLGLVKSNNSIIMKKMGTKRSI